MWDVWFDAYVELIVQRESDANASEFETDYLPVQAAARQTGYSSRRIGQLIKEKLVTSQYMNGQLLVSISSVEEYRASLPERTQRTESLS